MKTLSVKDWSFHKLTDDEIAAAWFWEIQREAGSGTVAWFALPKTDRATVTNYCNSGSGGIREIDSPHIERSPEYLATHEAAHVSSPLQLHVLEIDWSKGKNALAEDFKQWLQNHSGEKSRRDWSDYNNVGGRKSQFRAWLVDLAMYRGDKAGLNRDKAVVRFEPLRKWSNVGDTKDSKLSRSHWRQSCNNITAKLDEIKSFPLRSLVSKQG